MKNVDVADNIDDLFFYENENKEKTDQKKENIKNELLFNDKKSDLSIKDVEIVDLDDLDDLDFKMPKSLCPSPFNIIPIKKKALQNIMLMAKAVNEIASNKFNEDVQFEVYCYLLGKKEDVKNNELSVVTEIFIPPHTAKEDHVYVDYEGILALKEYINENDLIVLGWSHSHGKYDVYSSEKDDKNHKIVLNETNNYININEIPLKYIYEITVNTKEDIFGVVLTQYSCTYIAQSNNCKIKKIGNEYNEFQLENQYNNIKGMIRSRVNLVIHNNLSQEEIKERIREEILANFISKLFQSKMLLTENLSDDEEKSFKIVQNIIKKYDALISASAEEAVSDTTDTLLKLISKIKKSV